MKQRDLELLSSYLDGQLSPSDTSRLESRLLIEPELRSVLSDLRSARSMLRQLPMRKAPRNFRLTPKMVGKNPPLPRVYPAFRLTSVLATVMLFLTMGLNLVRPTLATASPGFGMGGGGAPDTFAAEAAPTEAPAAALEAPAATEAPAEESSIASAPMATETISGQEDSARIVDTPVAKEGETQNAIGGGVEQEPPQAPASDTPLVPAVWQWSLAGIALLSGLVMLFMRQISVNYWRNRK